jgi:hypothetical protein
METKMTKKLATIALGTLLTLPVATASFAQGTGNSGVNDAGRGMSNYNRGTTNNNNGYSRGTGMNSSAPAGVNDAGNGMNGGANESGNR